MRSVSDEGESSWRYWNRRATENTCGNQEPSSNLLSAFIFQMKALINYNIVALFLVFTFSKEHIYNPAPQWAQAPKLWYFDSNGSVKHKTPEQTHPLSIHPISRHFGCANTAEQSNLTAYTRGHQPSRHMGSFMLHWRCFIIQLNSNMKYICKVLHNWILI